VAPATDRRRTRLALAVLFAATGVTHFVAPRVFEPIVPAWAGDARTVVLGSGAAELAAAALLGRPRTARAGGWYSAALLLAVWPANIKMALDGGALAWARVPLQLPLVWLAVQVGRAGSPPPPVTVP